MARSSAFVTCAVTLCLTIAHPVSADPIQVTGTMNITREFAHDRVNLVGPGFAFDARVGWIDGYVGPFDCLPCRPGEVLNAGGILSTTVFGKGTLTLNGATYPVTESLDSPATLYMELIGSFVVPPFDATTAFVTVPFTMRSNVLIDLAQRATLRGGGTATIFFGPGGGGEPVWSTTRVRYDFTDPAAVPEPATLLMVGGGLAAAAFGRRRTRSLSHS
jgi:PEP-CTERM motif